MHKYPPIGAEQVIAGGIDVIIEPEMGGSGDLSEQTARAREFWSRFETVPAAKGGRIYVIDGGPVSRLGPRICDAVETVIECIGSE